MSPPLVSKARSCTLMPSSALAALIATLALAGVATAQESIHYQSDCASGSGPSCCVQNFCQQHRRGGTKVKDSLYDRRVQIPFFLIRAELKQCRVMRALSSSW